MKYTEAILSNSTRKPLWFEVSKMLIAVLKIYYVICYNFPHTFVPYRSRYAANHIHDAVLYRKL